MKMRFSILLTTVLPAAAFALPAEGPQPENLETRTEYFTHCQVVATAVKYRTCPSTSCTAVGQYPNGKVLDVVKTPLNDIPAWLKLRNGYYVYSYYCLPA
ncbi:hypothetical protein DL95DRAFT_394323 [Leptodontidium sp. 2 PMI_412]|nr:hypothetical protein DL95DRAFT_394323 [Leptodontidium sp. 2 PMI_412]